VWVACAPLFVCVGFSFVRFSFFFLFLLFVCLVCFCSLLVASVVLRLCYFVSVIVVLLRILFPCVCCVRGVVVRFLCGRVVAAVISGFPVDGVGVDASGVVDVVLWVDVEATGVDADCERLLEVAGVVTDVSGRSLGLELFSRVVDQGSAVEAECVVDGLRGRVAVMHARSGLSEQVRNAGGSGMVAGLVDMEMCAWLEECADAFVGLHGGESYRVWLGGNSVHADRGFVKRFLPCVYASLDHRVLDASSVARFLRAGGVSVEWVADSPAKHRALPDVLGCVRQYREMLRAVSELGAR
jgi:oligoribonuclease